jgi:phosphoribosylformimino-5-aminoimidazole carboxamide ribonucleotide (ProFAR) isomerase
MLIPCIDLQGGLAVQLVHGRRRELSVAGVFGLLDKFQKYPWLHIIDLDAAMGKKDNRELLKSLCGEAKSEYAMKVRVGGGIRAVAGAKRVLDWGAEQIIIGSAAFRDGKPNRRFLHQLSGAIGAARLVIALDTGKGGIVIEGWRRRLALRAEEVMLDLEPFCAGFLCTDVDREGTMRGARLRWFRKLRGATTLPIIAAGGIKTRFEIMELEKIGMDAAVGMALYKNRLH